MKKFHFGGYLPRYWVQLRLVRLSIARVHRIKPDGQGEVYLRRTIVLLLARVAATGKIWGSNFVVKWISSAHMLACKIRPTTASLYNVQ